MNSTKHAVAITLFASTKNGEVHYTKASAQKIIILLAKYHDKQIQRRWLFYCLADMEKAGYIRRKTRHRHDRDGKITQISSLITFTLAGIKYLVKKRISGALALLKKNDEMVKRRRSQVATREGIDATMDSGRSHPE